MYLYVKTHNKTGMKYLGKTNKKDPHEYAGSGKLWRRHLEKHGYDYTTEILLETDDKEELKNVAIYYSNLWDIVSSKDWANLMREQGDGGDTSETENYKKYLKSRNIEGKNNPFYGKTHSEKVKKILAEKASIQWKNVPKTEEQKQKIAQANTGKKFSEERKKNISLSCLGRIPYNKNKPAKKFICKYCNKEVGGEGNFERWHNNNCKNRM